MGLVQAKIGPTGGMPDAATLAFDVNVVAGNTVVILGHHSYSDCKPSITDSQGNTYSARGLRPSSANKPFEVFTAPIGSSGALTITVHMACGYFMSIAMAEVAGLIADPYDVQNLNEGNTTSPVDAGSITPTQSGVYIAVLFERPISCTYTERSGFTMRAQNGYHGYEDIIQSTAAAIVPDADASAVDVTYPVWGATAAFKMTLPPSTRLTRLFRWPTNVFSRIATSNFGSMFRATPSTTTHVESPALFLSGH